MPHPQRSFQRHADPDIRWTADIRQALVDAARRSLPQECCGLLFGRARANAGATIGRIVSVPNSAPGDRTRSFAIAPQAIRDHCRQAAPGEDLLGFFHSHPDGAPSPSAHDLEAASPWSGLLHAIVAPTRGGEIGLFQVHAGFWRPVAPREGSTW